jgi:hypothetical protein
LDDPPRRSAPAHPADLDGDQHRQHHQRENGDHWFALPSRPREFQYVSHLGRIEARIGQLLGPLGVGTVGVFTAIPANAAKPH